MTTSARDVGEKTDLRERLDDHFATHVSPHVEEWEARGSIPLSDLLGGLGRAGLLGLRFPSAYGGAGGTITDHLAFAEALGRVPSGSVGLAVTVHNDMVAPMLAEYGTETVRTEHLRPALSGDIVLAHAVSEHGAGSDVAAVATTAVPIPGGYRIHNTKT